MAQDGPIKPNLTFEEGVGLVCRLYTLQDVKCLKEFISYDNQNLLIEARRPDSEPGRRLEKFVLKLTNSKDSEHFELYQQLNEILLLLRGRGIQCCWPIQNASGKDLTLERLSFKHKDREEIMTAEFLTRIMTYIPGQFIGGAPLLTAKMCYEAGQLLGDLSTALQGYSGDKTQFIERSQNYTWSLNYTPRLRNHLQVLKEDSQRRVIGEILSAFQENVIKKKDNLTKGMIHGDFNDYNILVREKPSSSLSNGTVCPGDDKDVVGVLDFDDIMYSCIVYDVAIAIMYIMQCTNLERDPLESGGIMLAGFLSRHALTDDEWAALYYCVAARFAQSLVLGLYTHSLQPQNNYLLSTQKVGWQVLFDLWGQEVNDLYGQWRKLIKQYNK
ncbi:hydroxylysine kinase [Strongylocentrotus purpuratus]|uniref:Hydroxylysine kinase n=1 Tax=Strongylocentrotus purpuratus TaxID=7668 RepID=A0A7M7RF17_STRPU|nr:hydroxylysine kinase [Strongylocentrotus purpuratus]|eukprot:XP_011660593.1 PREDICTED: hydroxylysine kinase [Strongylocentrotus purpuratus]